mmetsp:Transcript_4564/g.13952  ORF Transcript_4564/g.13952 Transcript_4564/m.13952 type:complete len:387 (+) Transcript_4564:649-1809(+)
MTVCQTCATATCLNGQRSTFIKRLRLPDSFQPGDHLIDRITVEAQVGVIVTDRVEHRLQLLLADASALITVGDVLDGALLLVDLGLYLVTTLAVTLDLHGGGTDVLISQHGQCVAFLQKVVHRVDGRDQREAEQILDVRALTVHEQVHELAVLGAHLVRVHDLVAAAQFEERLKELLVVLKVLVLEQLLSGAVVTGHHQAREDGADVLQLGVDARRLALAVRNDVHLVGVLTHAERSHQQPQMLALVVGKAHRNVASSLHEPVLDLLRHVPVYAAGVGQCSTRVKRIHRLVVCSRGGRGGRGRGGRGGIGCRGCLEVALLFVVLARELQQLAIELLLLLLELLQLACQLLVCGRRSDQFAELFVVLLLESSLGHLVLGRVHRIGRA